MEEKEDVNFKNFRKHHEEYTPTWMKMFGGSLLSIVFLFVITFAGYIINSINTLQTQINSINSDSLTKKEFTERQKVMWDNLNNPLKTNTDLIHDIKERLNGIEQLSKEIKIWVKEKEKALDALNKDSSAYKEKFILYEAQLAEYKQLLKDIQVLRERIIIIEGKLAEKKN